MGREQYDDQVRADTLRKGDELHLLFMGGDEYVGIDRVMRTRTGQVHLWMSSSVVQKIKDTVPADKQVWIRKRAA
jgi:hypothetical protein